jgi:uncharacterized membrane protein YbhN (UPF0104 family)
MKTINWCACIAFGIIAFTAIIVAIVSTRYEYLAIAFACGGVSYAAYQDVKNPLL